MSPSTSRNGRFCVTAPCKHLVEHARIEEAGEEVAFRELAQLFEVAPVLAREPADQERRRRNR